jgi:hypothetical protein
MERSDDRAGRHHQSSSIMEVDQSGGRGGVRWGFSVPVTIELEFLSPPCTCIPAWSHRTSNRSNKKSITHTNRDHACDAPPTNQICY